MNKKVFFFFIILFAFAACNNNNDDKKAASASASAKPEIPPQVKRLMEEVKQHPDSSGLRFKLATSLDSIGSYKEALGQMDSLIKNDSLNYGFWFAKAQIFEHAKDTAQAIQDYGRAIKIYPSPQALLSVANLYAEQKNERSILICNQVRNMGLGRETDAGCDFIAGVYNARTGNKQQAIKLFDRCIANDYTYMPAYIEKGLVYFDGKQYREALNVFQFASTVDHLYADAYYYMARCYEMINIKDSAVLRFKQAISLDKTLTQAYEGLKRVQ
ncbi:MAG: tetratricopeptide repeat protein [Ilyomonas sp.]